MSNLIFPSNIAVGWDVVKTPKYSTSTQKSVSGKMARLANQQNPDWKWELTYEYLDGNAGDAGALAQLMGFFMAVKGSFDSFLYLDPTDNSEANAPIGVGDGVTTTLQLKRTVGGGLEDIQAVFGVPVVTRNDWQNPVNLVLWSEDATQWSLNNLLVTPNAAVSPAGDTTADLLTKNTPASSTGAATTSQTADGVNQYTFTIFMMASANSTQAAFGLFDATAQTWPAATATIISGPGAASAPSGNPSTVTGLSTTQWTRVKYTLTAAPTAGHTITGIVYPDTQLSVTPGNGNYFWGAQTEFGSNASNYVKTTSLAGIGPISLSSQPRTSLLLQNKDFTQAVWTKTAVAVTAAATTAPDGSGTTAQLIAKTTAGTSALIAQTFATADGVSRYAVSFWVKASTTSSQCSFTIFDNTGASFVASTNTILSGPGVLAGGSPNNVTGLSQTQWTRIQCVSNAAPTAAHAIQLLLYPDKNTSIVIGNGNYFYASQAEVGTISTSYIPTTTVTRTVTDWTLNTTTGILTMGETPLVGFTFTATFNFYFRVHFTDDAEDFTNFAFKFWALKKISFESDRQ